MRILLPVSVLSAAFAASLAWAESTTLSVKGMHCGGCEKSIEDALAKESAVKSVDADHKSGSVRVEFKDGEHLSLETLAKIIDKAGYKAELKQ